MKRVFDLYLHTKINAEDTYLRSYPVLIRYSQQLVSAISVDALILVAHAVYGWMPTVLKMNTDPNQLVKAATLLHEAAKRDLDASELGVLTDCVNRSIVGVSKLLHFAYPHRYPIWDSRVFKFVHGRKPHSYQVNSIPAYLAYQSKMLALSKDSHAATLQNHVSKACGYPVTRLRALELIMFLNSEKAGKKSGEDTQGV